MLCVYLCLINITIGGCIKCDIFLISKGNKINFTHVIVDYMGKQHVENCKEIRDHYCIKSQNVFHPFPMKKADLCFIDRETRSIKCFW